MKENPHDAAEAINVAADQGYRLLFLHPFVVMRLDTAPPDTYRYLPWPESGGPARLINALNQQGALGYRWLDEAGMLEKEPHPHNYEYRMPEGFTGNALKRSREALLDQGFRPVRDVGFPEIFIREIGDTRPTARPKQFRVADALRKSNVIKDISELAAQGYRYRSQVSSKMSGGRAVAMEECDSRCGGPFEYRSFDVKVAAQLERDLNALGHDGFRILAKSLGMPPHLAERPANHAQSFVYRVVEASDASTTEQKLNEGDRDGFIPLGVTAHIGWNVHPYIVLEKATSATP